MSEPWMALIDMNSYFATLEQQSNPFLRGKPIGIVKDHGRTCVIAASAEAKKLGIKTGCRLREARELCPTFIAVPADFDKYFYNTLLLKKIFESLSPATDIFSLDEAFIDLKDCRKIYADTQSFFTAAQKKVHDELGEWVTFSLGIGRNRLQAKLASEFAGVDHYFEITEKNLDACLAEAKVDDICGIGYRLSKRLRMLQIEHPYQLNFYDDAFLIEHFGVFWGPELRRIGRGENSHLLDLIDTPATHMKSVGRSKTLFTANANHDYLRQMIYNLAEDMCFKARRMKMAGCHVALYLTGTEGQWWAKEFRMKTPVCHTNEVFHLLDRLFSALQIGHASIIKIGVRLGELHPLEKTTQCWLPEWDSRERLYHAVDAVNEKHGLYTLKPARLLGFKIIHPEVTGFLGDKIYQFGNQ